jgi:hypothetical protein
MLFRPSAWPARFSALAQPNNQQSLATIAIPPRGIALTRPLASSRPADAALTELLTPPPVRDLAPLVKLALFPAIVSKPPASCSGPEEVRRA